MGAQLTASVVKLRLALSALEGSLRLLCDQAPRSSLVRREPFGDAPQTRRCFSQSPLKSYSSKPSTKRCLCPSCVRGRGRARPGEPWSAQHAELPPPAFWQLLGLDRAVLAPSRSNEKGTPGLASSSCHCNCTRPRNSSLASGDQEPVCFSAP